MSWQKEVDELRRREALAREMGGPEKIKRQRDAGRLTLRERIDALLDPQSFHEIGAIAGKAEYDEEGNLKNFTPANSVFGRGRVEGRPIIIYGDDFTVRGGANDASIWQKQVMAEQMANELRLPIIRLIEGTGGGGSVKTLETAGYTYIPGVMGWEFVVDNLNKVPVIALALGPVAGIGSARVVASHFSVMVKGLSQMFVAGPPVVNRIGENVTKEELGGSSIHTRNGAIDLEVDSEEEAFAAARRFLSYLPSSAYDLPPRAESNDDIYRREDWLIDAIPRDRRKVYKPRKIIDALVDRDSFFETGRFFGRSVVTGFAHLDGWPVGILAGDPYHYGAAWTADACDKVIRFVDLAETFHLPVVHLVDVPGFLIGTEAERTATIRHGARAMSAIYQASVPWCSIILRKVFGVAGAAHSNFSRAQYRYAWPSGDWGSLPVEGGIEAAYKSDLEKSDDPEALLKELNEKMERVRSPFRTAEHFNIEEIIDPRDTRPLLCEFANLAAPLRTAGRSKVLYRP